jgi:D-alanyl-D-alanine dipeptidase
MTVAGPVLLADERVAAIPVVPSAEPLVRLRDGPRLSLARRGPVAPVGKPVRAPGTMHALVRQDLARRLQAAAELLTDGLRLHVVEGYRPPELQRAWFETYRGELVAREPGLAADRAHELASRFIAPPEVAAHPSGAAVDVTLLDAAGRALDMGTAIDAIPDESDGATAFDAPNLSPSVRENRARLAACLGAVGLVNYPTEWWHWSYGDRYWAFVTERPTACYGPA